MKYLCVMALLVGCSGGPQSEQTTVGRSDVSNQSASTAPRSSSIDDSVKRCVESCVMSRQMEAMDHTLIEQQCLEGCRMNEEQDAPPRPTE